MIPITISSSGGAGLPSPASLSQLSGGPGSGPGGLAVGPLHPGGGSSDTQSEVSSTADAETRDLVTALGLSGQDELHQERFRVDRRRLEQMMLGDGESAETAGTFFQKIMEDTHTYISWPLRLKIGAKSKKDPHIRVAGRLEDVQVAKQKILAVLDARGARVTMKLDVSYTEHSHIIGKGGLTIKKVMNDTGCHIHFPDSNRSNPNEKSNQVSIAGDLAGVEAARASVRAITPLIFSFELPVLGASQQMPDVTSPYVQKVQESYNVQVMFRTRPKLHATLVVIKGQEKEVVNVKKATLLLIQYMCDVHAKQIQVQMTIEISPQHHTVVLGSGSQQLKNIMQRTSTQIMFPDAQDPNIPPLKRSCVTITGNIDGVYSARQQLIGSLPLVLMFDLPESVGDTIEPETLTNIMNSLDVFINVRHKPKQNSLSVIVKGIERCATNIYEARNLLLKISEPRVIAEIPVSYQMPNSEVLLPTLAQQPQPPMSPVLSPLPWNPMGAGPFVSPLGAAVSRPPSPLQIHNTSQMSGLRAIQGMGLMNSVSDSALAHDSSGYQSFSSSSNSLEFPSTASAPISPRNSPNNNANQQYKAVSASSINEISNSLRDLTIERRAPGCEKKSLDSMALANLPTCSKGFSKTLPPAQKTETCIAGEYSQMKMLAMQALNIPPAGELRVPNSGWAGLGFSQTSPGLQTIFTEDDDVWAPSNPSPSLVRSMNSISATNGYSTASSNPIEKLLNPPQKQIAVNDPAYKKPCLSSVLASAGLDKYIPLFESHEVDLATFCSLSEHDLKHIGVEAWGARRRMLIAAAECVNRGPRGPLLSTGDVIHHPQSNTNTLNVAPGAERRHHSSTDFW